MIIQPKHLTKTVILFGLIFLNLIAARSALSQTSPNDILVHYQAQAETQADSMRGQVLFNTRHGNDWSCSTCHGSPPTISGKHASSGKGILPLAPAANDKSLTSLKKTEKWFRRNCRDVLSRECTAQEKTDVVSYLLTLKLN